MDYYYSMMFYASQRRRSLSSLALLATMRAAKHSQRSLQSCLRMHGRSMRLVCLFSWSLAPSVTLQSEEFGALEQQEVSRVARLLQFSHLTTHERSYQHCS